MEQGRRWLVWLGMLGVLLLALGACGDEGVSVQVATSTVHLPSTVKFIAAGGLYGTYTLTSEDFRSSQYHPNMGRFRALKIHVANSAWEIDIDLPGPSFYTGPGVYRMSKGIGSVSFASADHTKVWDFATGSAKAGCEVTFNSDTSWDAKKASATTELKGVFTCSRLNSDGSIAEEPLIIGDGQFDVVAENVD